MIKEYAVEPSILDNWSDCRYFIDSFSIEKGRIVSEYPKHWKKMVFDSLIECKPKEKLKIIEKLDNLKYPTLWPRKHDWDDSLAWLDNSVVEHTNTPFHAILSNTDKHENEFIICADDCSETSENTRWLSNVSVRIKRTATEMGKTSEWLLKHSRQIILIDRNFRREAKWLNTLKEFLKIIAKHENIALIQYHLSLINGETTEFFASEIEKRIKNDVPKNCILEFVYRDRSELHNRNILTELGALHFGIGLDEYQIGDERPEYDEITLLPDEIRSQLWSDHFGKSAFITFQSK